MALSLARPPLPVLVVQAPDDGGEVGRAIPDVSSVGLGAKGALGPPQDRLLAALQKRGILAAKFPVGLELPDLSEGVKGKLASLVACGDP